MDENRSTIITIDDTEYTLVLTNRATKAIAGRYGGIEKLGEKLLKSESFEMALDEVLWLVALLANQGIQIHNLRNRDNPLPLLSEEELELLTSPGDMPQFKGAILDAMTRGIRRNIVSEEAPSKNAGAE